MICYKCREDKDKSCFSLTQYKTEARRGWQSYCKSCMSAYSKAIPKEIRSRQSKKSYNKHRDNPTRVLKTLLGASSVDRSQLDFEWANKKLMDLDFKCEITGIPFTWTARSPTALSIDRIDSTKGYTKDNVRFVCWWINAAMGNWGLDRLKEFLEQWRINGSRKI